MTGVLFVILIISQLICFYFIVLLNLKIAKFKDLEKRQDQLIREMDDAIGLYLVEMKEENDRLIKELSNIEGNEKQHAPKAGLVNIEENKTNEKESVEEVKIDAKPFVPKSMAANAYKQQKNVSQPPQMLKPQQNEQDSPILPSFEQKVLNFYKEGKTIDEIAKIMQKGKTEIELLIKFHA
ncbi:hypothetical protein D1B33_01865 [Lysinibacillus yapensis]|uniref:Swarming motility protein SwrB n=1 Tax=Ureibacillus yapensis TaxID=2304605 RepID=A0A396SH65_9BACL|nr:hypothetical protein [Lysinibacillus yapensis]RHW39618.1 hypothetical protein D1B33_01865 [Lysinibacillus yapensis]